MYQSHQRNSKPRFNFTNSAQYVNSKKLPFLIFFTTSINNKPTQLFEVYTVRRVGLFNPRCLAEMKKCEKIVIFCSQVELDLSENVMREVPTEAWKNTKALMRLNLSGNPIKLIRSGAFQKLQVFFPPILTKTIMSCK